MTLIAQFELNTGIIEKMFNNVFSTIFGKNVDMLNTYGRWLRWWKFIAGGVAGHYNSARTR